MPADRPDEEPTAGPARHARAWRIQARRAEERGELVYDVYQGVRRRAWGLKDRETAERWLRRLAPPGDPVEDAPDAPEEDGAPAVVPRRVWWNDA